MIPQLNSRKQATLPLMLISCASSGSSNNALIAARTVASTQGGFIGTGPGYHEPHRIDTSNCLTHACQASLEVDRATVVNGKVRRALPDRDRGLPQDWAICHDGNLSDS